MPKQKKQKTVVAKNGESETDSFCVAAPLLPPHVFPTVLRGGKILPPWQHQLILFWRKDMQNRINSPISGVKNTLWVHFGNGPRGLARDHGPRVLFMRIRDNGCVRHLGSVAKGRYFCQRQERFQPPEHNVVITKKWDLRKQCGEHLCFARLNENEEGYPAYPTNPSIPRHDRRKKHTPADAGMVKIRREAACGGVVKSQRRKMWKCRPGNGEGGRQSRCTALLQTAF